MVSAVRRSVFNNPILREAAKYALPDLAINGLGMGIEANFSELCRTLDGYLYNTIFEELGPAGFDITADMDIEDIKPRGLKNPVSVIVGFYEEHALTGRMVPPPPPTSQIVEEQDSDERPDGDLWIESTNAELAAPILDVWAWSNMQTKLSQISVNAANYGNCLLVVSEEIGDDGEGKVYIEVRHPAELINYQRHRRGHLTYAELESWETELDAQGNEVSYRFTRRYTKDTIETLRDGKPWDFYGMGETKWRNPHGFVPVVWVRHKEVTGEDRGLNAYHSGLSEINDMCLTASVVGTNIGKHISPQWAAMGATPPAGGKPMERADNVWFFPGGGTLQQIIAKLDIEGAYLHIDSLMDTLETKFPELLLPKVGDQKRDISGAAVRGILTGLIRRGLRARESYEKGLKDAVQMALSMGANFGGTGKSLWESLNLPAFGDPTRAFEFHWPDILPMNKLERLKLENDEKAIELNIVNLQLQIDEVRRKRATLARLANAPTDPYTGYPIDPQTGFATDPTTLQPVIPQTPVSQAATPGTVGPGSTGGEGSSGQAS